MADSTDLLIGNSFTLKWGGGLDDKVASISEVSGLEEETDVQELVQSTKDGKVIVYKVPGANPIKMGKITIKYAAFSGDPLWKWRADVAQGKMERKDVTIELHTQDNKKAKDWTFANCWPSKFSFGSLSAKSNDPLMVTVTMEHEGIKIKGYNA